MTLREVLHAHIPVLRPDASVRDAVDRMDIYQFPALVVVDRDEKPLAVITEGDLARAVLMRGDVTSLANEPAIVFSTSDPIVGSPDSEISEALHLMLARGLTVLPVVDSERLIGMVLRVDLMQALLMDHGTVTHPTQSA
jgi:CBS domain-containing protein